MSQPKRYSVAVDDPWFGDGAYITEDGKYVLHSDYAALAAENERLIKMLKICVMAEPLLKEAFASCGLEHKPLSENPTWQAVGAYAEAKEEIARLTAEKEAIVQQGIRDHQDWRSKLNFLEADYKAEVARLTAENERLRSKLSFSQRISEICKQSHDGDMITVQGCTMSGKTVLPDLCQCECLRAENERLRKAGDAMARHYLDVSKVEWGQKTTYVPPSIERWNAAKEGRDAK